ncbi:MAG: MATE family efflux transporter, partial [Allisonella histaminiformans]|uniref:MATE family efflux transporter n=1 Tax=Allisonella histaminiformans TaxID=209880 RepID=UPI0023558C0B
MKQQEMDLIHGPLSSNIWRMAIPLALTGLMQQFFNAADIAMVGRFVDAQSMAAVGSNAPLITTLLSLFIGLSIGTNVVLARFIGQGREDKVNDGVHTSLVMAFLCGLVLAGIGEIATRPTLLWLKTPPEVFSIAELYLRILFIEQPFLLLYNFEASIFRAIGDTRTPLLALSLGGVCKIALNLIILLLFHGGAGGVAIGSIIANIISSLFLFRHLHRSHTMFHVSFRRLKMHGDIVLRILKIGLPAGLQGIVFCLSNLIIQSALNSLGPTVMAASAAGYNIEIFVYYIMYAMAQVNTTVVGQNYGAREFSRCRKATRICFKQTAILSLILTAIILFFSDPLLSLFSTSPDVVEYGKIRLH